MTRSIVGSWRSRTNCLPIVVVWLPNEARRQDLAVVLLERGATRQLILSSDMPITVPNVIR